MSASGDADIINLRISLLSTYKESVFINNKSGTNRVLYWLANFDLLPKKMFVIDWAACFHWKRLCVIVF